MLSADLGDYCGLVDACRDEGVEARLGHDDGVWTFEIAHEGAVLASFTSALEAPACFADLAAQADSDEPWSGD